MARILFSSFSNVTWTKEKYLDSFAEGFTRSLARNGNEVLNIRNNEFVFHPCTSIKQPFVNKQKILSQIKSFNPDLIITLNNSFPIKEVISETTCPIILYSADGPDFYAFKEMLKEHADRYSFLETNEASASNIMRSYPWFTKERFCPFGYATDFKKRDVDQDVNISFLGSIPNYTGMLIDYLKNCNSNTTKDQFFQEMDRFKTDVFSNMHIDLPGFRDDLGLETSAIFLMTTKHRFFTLSALADLGLSIYGYNSICNAGMYNYDILKAYKYDLCVNIEQSEQLFNRSKISLNLDNARNVDGFSWRVPDILSSNSVLLSPRKNELIKLMKGYAELPLYESPE